MFPPAYTLTVLVLTLLQFSFDKNFRNVCEKEGLGQTNATSACQNNRDRKEIRQLNDNELTYFINIYNENLLNNNTQQWGDEISELGVVQIFDELLEKKLKTPYWDYRIDLNLSDPSSGAIWDDPRFSKVSEAVDAQWLAEFINNDIQEDSNDFFDDPNIDLWKRRAEALNAMRKVKGNDVFWHLLILVSIETGIDQQRIIINKTNCAEYHTLYWNGTHCTSYLRDGAHCLSNSECVTKQCNRQVCGVKKLITTTTSTTPSPTPQSFTTSYKIPPIVYPTQSNLAENATNLAEISHKNFPWMTTEFLAKELEPPPKFTLSKSQKSEKKKKSKKRKHKKGRTTVATTEPTFYDQIPPTTLETAPTLPGTSPPEALNETNTPIEPERYEADTLDALLVYMPKAKEPAGMIPWTNRMPFRMAYFSFTIIEGGLGKNRKLKEKGARRSKGARIYVKGLDMPSGYKQVTQGKQLRNGIGALARTLHPDNNGPFVEFKMRVENRYGIACKQMCLDSHQRYRRCARKTIRLSPYKRGGSIHR
ncbi:unnamed protein product [Bursaphelenchus xylophilus]|uniref:(pine wood nematode) hypothetical protein n=1 Tax=Bursaphelenchus xylophilus TaxID=6326 RepID=A0A1I7RHB8_BURXY|nr:unnamed protein product [Bursaphelenchus xylophilus]CAG9115866.1 unnamed protein product [Bursaphelenchus xylophilus]